MTDIEQKALVNEAKERLSLCAGTLEESLINRLAIELEAAIEQHEAFRQEVSDAAVLYNDEGAPSAFLGFDRFIIAKPDPLVEVISSALREGSPFDEDGSHDYTAEAKVIAAALAARGLEVRKIGEGE